MTVQLKRRPLTVEEYNRMIEIGILTELDRVELINGEILEMGPVGSQHAACVDYFTETLPGLVAGAAKVRIQNPISLPELSQPEPDIVIVRRRPDNYRRQHPTPEDVLLLIEVSDSTLDYDREIKAPIYARAGIPEYWIVNIPDQQIEVYRQPAGEVYRLRELFRRGETVPFEPLGIALSVTEVLGEE